MSGLSEPSGSDFDDLPEPPLPKREGARLRALKRYRIIDSEPEDTFDRITRFAADLFAAPVAYISFIDRRRQWIKSSYGHDLRQTDRELAFCAYTILQEEVLVVPDASADERFRRNPMVLGPPGIRFYAGCPVKSAEGLAIGTIAVVDTQPRPALEEHDRARLEFLARVVMNELEVRLSAGDVQAEVAERRRAEAALRESRELLRRFIDHTPSGMTLKDTEGRLVLANKCFERRYGVSEAEALGRTLQELFPGGQFDDFAEMDRQVLASGAVVQREYDDVLFDDESRILVMTKFPVLDAAGETIGIGTVSTDVTDQRRLEEQLRHAHKMEAVDQLTGGVAHDFNNLLAVIAGNLELLGEQAAGDPSLQRLIEPALRAAGRGAALTRCLLAFSRRQALRPAATDLRALVDGMNELLTRTLGGGIETRTSAAADLQSTLVDPVQLEAALLNLASNARDAMLEGGRLTIGLSNVSVAQPDGELLAGDYVLVSVADSGCGIGAEHLERVCHPFFTTKEVGKGSGLGLSMVYGFVKQSGGHMAIESTLGRGTTVMLYLPRAGAPPD